MQALSIAALFALVAGLLRLKKVLWGFICQGGKHYV